MESILGRGGMGVVYLATDLRLKRRIALKILAPELSQDQAFRDRFVRESEVAASLEDPNVVPIYEAGEADGQLFIAMRYVEGTDLGTLIREFGPIDPIRTASIVSQVASALDAAHDRGLVHRDVKPANILISQRDRSRGEHVYLTDFGLIRRMAQATSLTRTGQFMGTIDYVAPEQIRGEPVDARADVYSMGCVLYECLIGQPPFANDLEVAVLYAHLEQPPPAVTARRPELPPAIDDVVAKAMAKQPQDRYQSAGALAEGARDALQEGLPAGPRGRPGPRRWPRRRLVVAGAVVAIVAVVGATLPFVLHGSGRPPAASAVSVGSDSIAVVDAATGRVVGDVPTGSRPSAVAAGAGAVWVANAASGTVSRIDPASQKVVGTIIIPGTPVALAVGFGAVWVVNGEGRTVFQINPAANKVVNMISVGNGPDAVAVGAGGVWVANSLDDTVSRIDPAHDVAAPGIPVGSHPSSVVVEQQAVWVANSAAGTVMEIDPKSNAVTRTIPVGNGPTGLAAGSGVIWVANSLDGTASRIDAGSGLVTATVPVGDGPSSMAVSDGSVWVANQFGGSLSRIGPEGTVTDTVRVGNAPQGVVLAGGDLWVAVGASGTAHRGGTLLLESSLDAPDSVDPALAYTGSSWQILITTNDGLVAFRRVGGPDGATLVPDLATSLPIPTDGGRTYTFQLRPNIRYSNGQPVRAGDFRYAIERGFRGGSPTPYYQGIVGGEACVKDPATCDLSQGIVTDDSSGTVTFHLTAPDPEFPYKLALSFADAVPPGTPDPTASTTVPATGPYMIQSYRPGTKDDPVGSLVLVRNPQFHEWSAAAQPDGYPHRIAWTFGVGVERLTTDVEKGRADVALEAVDFPPPDRLQELTTRFTNQVHTFLQPATLGIALNTNLAPFNAVRVRRAVNDAFDRDAAVKALQPALPTCQFLPPNFPGYRPYCPYTLNPGPGGTWTAPDLARAQRLIAASHTVGTRVTVWAITNGPPSVALARLFVSEMNGLGYPTTLRTIANPTKYFKFVSNSNNRVQAAFAVWAQDYAAASNFLDLMRCSSFVPGSGGNENIAQLCDPALDRQIEQALSLQQTDPAAASDLWAAIDRRDSLDAPWVFVLNQAGLDFVSARVGNYQHNPQWGMLVDQLWVK